MRDPDAASDSRSRLLSGLAVGEVELVELVRRLQAPLTDSDEAVRRRSLQLLDAALQLPSIHQRLARSDDAATGADSLATFFSQRTQDQQSIAQPQPKDSHALAATPPSPLVSLQAMSVCGAL